MTEEQVRKSPSDRLVELGVVDRLLAIDRHMIEMKGATPNAANLSARLDVAFVAIAKFEASLQEVKARMERLGEQVLKELRLATERGLLDDWMLRQRQVKEKSKCDKSRSTSKRPASGPKTKSSKSRRGN